MIETKNKVICEKNAEIYGIRNGDWVNVAVFDLVKKDMKAQAYQTLIIPTEQFLEMA